jgi:hypothetical protein
MGEMEHIQSGMPVYRADGLEIGKVKEHWGETFYVGNHSISVEMVDQVLDQGVYLKGTYTGFAPVGDSFDEGVIRVAARSEGALAPQEATFAANEREER